MCVCVILSGDLRVCVILSGDLLVESCKLSSLVRGICVCVCDPFWRFACVCDPFWRFACRVWDLCVCVILSGD